jgi:hypothetical protein
MISVSLYDLCADGFLQKKICIVLDAANERPEGTIFIVSAEGRTWKPPT